MTEKTEITPTSVRRWRLRNVALLLLAAMTFATVLLGVTLPGWGGTLLAMALRDQGVQVDRVEAVGYRSWELSGLRWSEGGGTVEAERVEIPQPFAYLGFLWDREHSAVEIRVSRWRFERDPRQAEPRERLPLNELLEQLSEIRLTPFMELVPDGMARAVFWMPPLELTEGLALLGNQSVYLDRLRFANLQFSGEGRLAIQGRDFPFELGVRLGEYRIVFTGEESGGWMSLSGALEWGRTDGLELTLEGRLAGGDFGMRYRESVGEGAFPTFRLDWSNPEWERFAATELPWKTRDSVLRVRLVEEGFMMELTGRGELETDEELFDEAPWEVEMLAQGTLEGVSLRELRVALPDLRVGLSHPVQLSWAPWELDREAELTVAFDAARLLSETPMAEWGWVEAKLRGKPDPTRLEAPMDVRLEASTSPDSIGQVLQAEAWGTVDLEGLALKEAAVRYGTSRLLAEGGELRRLEGKWYLRDLAFSADVNIREIPWMPEVMPWPERVWGRGTASTDADAVYFDVDLEVDRWQPHPLMAPLTLEALVNGRGTEIQEAQMTFTTDAGDRVMAVLSGAWLDRGWHAEILELEIAQTVRGAFRELGLAAPWSLSGQQLETGLAVEWEEMLLEEGTGEAALTLSEGRYSGGGWPGLFGFSIRHLDTGWLTSWAPELELPWVGLEVLQATWRLEPGEASPVVKLLGKGMAEAAEDWKLAWAVDALHDNGKVTLKDLRVRLNPRSEARFRGEIPGMLMLGGADGHAWHWHTTAPLRFSGGMTVVDEAIDFPAGPYRGTARNVELSVDLGGTLEQPRGSWESRIQAITLVEAATEEAWEVDNLILRGSVSPEHIELADLGFRFAGQPVHGSAVMPMGRPSWNALWMERRPPDLQRLQPAWFPRRCRWHSLPRGCPRASGATVVG